MLIKGIKNALLILLSFLLILFFLIIIQYKSSNIVTKKFSLLTLTLQEKSKKTPSTSTPSSNPSASSSSSFIENSIENSFKALYEGLIFYTNDKSSFTASLSTGENIPLTLLSYKVNSSLSFTLNFTYDTSITFTLPSDAVAAPLSLYASFPSTISSLTLPYSINQTLTPYNTSDSNKATFTTATFPDSPSWQLTSAATSSSFITFNTATPSALYSFIDKTNKFTYSSIATIEDTLPESIDTLFNKEVDNLKTSILSSFNPATLDDKSESESEVLSYLSIMGSRAKLLTALDAIPTSYKRSALRTYLTATYFDDLMNKSHALTKEFNLINTSLQEQQEQSSQEQDTSTLFDILNNPLTIPYLTINYNKPIVANYLSSLIATSPASLSYINSGNILLLYVKLSSLSSYHSSTIDSTLHNTLLTLKPFVAAALEKIQDLCVIDNDNIVIADKTNMLKTLDIVKTASYLLQYASLINETSMIKTAKFIIYSYLKEIPSSDTSLLSSLYPLIEYQNNFYPHIAIIDFNDPESPVWAWTVATSILTKHEANTLTLTLNFPALYTHYLIIGGIKQFNSIYIYGLAFRSDTRFEAYNSSGYIYNTQDSLLLLKSRHRTIKEDINLIY